MNKRTLSYALWALIEQLVPGNNGDRGQTGEDNMTRVMKIIGIPALIEAMRA